MKELDLSQVFCEVVSGLAGIFIFFGLLDALEVQGIKDIVVWFGMNMSIPIATGLFVIAYLLGLILDAFGLLFDKLIDKCLGITEPTADELKQFYSKVPNHVFGYWKEQWVYFSCYRNILMCLIPGFLIWTYVAHKYWGMKAVLGVSLGSLVLGFALWESLKDLKTIYSKIPGRFV